MAKRAGDYVSAPDAYPGLVPIIKRAEALQRLDREMRAALPEKLASQIQLADIDTREGVVTVISQSQALATNIRFQQPAILKALKELTGKQNLHRVKVRPLVDMPTPERRESTLPPPTKSDESAAVLQASANDMPEGPLKQSLQRLANSVSESGNDDPEG